MSISPTTLQRLKDDIIKMLVRSEKFGVMDAACLFEKEEKTQHVTESIIWYTDKYYCPKDNISVPEFTPQHFSPNRQE